MTGSGAREAAREAHQHPVLDAIARVGLIGYGLVYGLIGVLALKVAWGEPDRDGPSSGGALDQLAESTVGTIALWATAVGLAGLAFWQLLEAAVGDKEHRRDPKGVVDRLKHVGKALIFGAIGAKALSTATSGPTEQSDSDKAEGLTAWLLGLPLGWLLVVAIAVGVGVYGLYAIRKGWTERFRDELEPEGQTGDSGRGIVLLGKIGYISKGIAFLIVAGLFMTAAATTDSDEAGSIDDAVATLLDQPYGPALLTVLGAGLCCFGLFALAWARHRDG